MLLIFTWVGEKRNISIYGDHSSLVRYVHGSLNCLIEMMYVVLEIRTAKVDLHSAFCLQKYFIGNEMICTDFFSSRTYLLSCIQHAPSEYTNKKGEDPRGSDLNRDKKNNQIFPVSCMLIIHV